MWDMRRLVAQLKKANATLVQELYSEALEELDTPFSFRGVSVNVSKDSIFDYYWLMNQDAQGDRGIEDSEITA